jgi:hypothetical protein
MAVYTEAVQKLYVAYFNRPADAAGLTYWENIVTANGGNTDAVSVAFANSQEYKDTFAGQSQYQIINTIYQNLFGREAEPAGLAYWGQGLINGTFTIAEAVTTIAGSAQTTDATAYANKVKAATAFTAALDTSAEILGYSGTAANLAAKTWLSKVTTDASLTAAVVPATLNASIAGVISTGSASTGQNFTLTATVGEQVTGTAGNDVFSAVIDTATTSTFNTGDTINGMGGQDTLNLIYTGAAGLPVGATVSNVEIININYANTAALVTAPVLNSANFAGVQQLWQNDSEATAVDFQGVTVGAGVTAGFRSTGVSATAVQANATVTAAAGVTAVAVALEGVASASTITLAETTATNIGTATVSGSVVGTPGAGSTNTLTLAAAATTDIDVLNLSLTSNTNVNVTALDNLNTFNAAGSTGNLTIDLAAQTELTSATFGSGNDTVAVNTTAITLAGFAAGATSGTVAIDLGAGNDVLTLTAGANAVNLATTITLGAGNDTLKVASLANLSAVTAAGLTADMITVTDFVAAQDVLDLSGLTQRDVLVNTELANVAAATDFAAALAVVAAATNVSEYSVFSYGGDTYVFNNDATAGLNAGDGLLKITGLAVEALTGTNFVA